MLDFRVQVAQGLANTTGGWTKPRSVPIGRRRKGMNEQRATIATPVLVIGEADGDGPILKLVPPPLNNVLRSTANRLARQRVARLIRVAHMIYPILQKLEDKALPDDQKLLQGVPFQKALQDDEKIERGLRLFVSAWKSNFIRLLDSAGKAIPPDKRKTYTGTCGLTVEQAEMYFIDLALIRIFQKNPKSLRRLRGMVNDPDALPKMRVLAHFQQLALTELVTGLGPQAGQVLSTIEPEKLYALATLKVYHLRALRSVLGAGFKNIADWDAEVIRAIGVHFECVEQIRDLGDAIGVVQGPEAIAALAQWNKRDITEQVNEERARRGMGKLKGRRFETDIGAARVILGSFFNTLMAEPPDLLEAFGKLITRIRQTDKVDRKDRIDEVRLFCERYLEYMNTDALKALGMVGDNPTSFGEALYILEGLFSKPGVGRKFFEGPLQTPEGVQALAGLKADIEDMKKRGSIKGESEIGQLISNSDILDRHIAPFISFK